MLLNTVKECTSYKDIRTVHGIKYPTFKEACRAFGFLDDDNEWTECINEAAICASGMQLYQLYMTIMRHCEVTDLKFLWKSTWQVLFEDMQYRRRRIPNFRTLQLYDSRMKAYALIEIEKFMRQVGRSIKDYPQIEML
jgi:hypothetical protein